MLTPITHLSPCTFQPGPGSCFGSRPAATGQSPCRVGCVAAQCRAGSLECALAAIAHFQRGVAGAWTWNFSFVTILVCQYDTACAGVCGMLRSLVSDTQSSSSSKTAALVQHLFSHARTCKLRAALLCVTSNAGIAHFYPALPVLQEAMTLNGPYAWAYDASAISIGSLTPTLTGDLGMMLGMAYALSHQQGLRMCLGGTC